MSNGKAPESNPAGWRGKYSLEVRSSVCSYSALLILFSCRALSTSRHTLPLRLWHSIIGSNNAGYQPPNRSASLHLILVLYDRDYCPNICVLLFLGACHFLGSLIECSPLFSDFLNYSPTVSRIHIHVSCSLTFFVRTAAKDIEMGVATHLKYVSINGLKLPCITGDRDQIRSRLVPVSIHHHKLWAEANSTIPAIPRFPPFRPVCQ